MRAPTARRAVPAVATWMLPLLLLHGCARTTPFMAVGVTVVDLRSEPRSALQPMAHDPSEETQLLYGERIRVRKTTKGWAYVEAPEQPEFTHAQRWQGYPGWVPTSALVPWEPLLEPNIVVSDKWAPTWTDAYGVRASVWQFPMGARLRAIDMGGALWKVELFDGSTVWMPHRCARALSELRALSTAQKRQMILRQAEAFLGDRYYWGGRSPQRTAENLGITGVDCSGLVNLAYRAVGIDIPRDAHEQFLRAHPVMSPQPGDLIFLSERQNPTRIVHVMLDAGKGEIIEGPGTGQVVRRIALQQRLGQPADSLTPGLVVEGQTIFFGTYLP